MSEAIPPKKVDESWKEQVEQERHQPQPGPSEPPPASSATPSQTEELPEARFDLFVSGVAMDALVALGDAPHPVTRKHTFNLAQARYLIDLLGVLADKTQGNLSADEERLLKDALYQLRMRYLAKKGG